MPLGALDFYPRQTDLDDSGLAQSQKAANKEKRLETELLTLKEVQTRLKVGKTTVYKLVNQNKLPVVHITRTPRFRQIDVENLINQSMN